VVGSQITHAVCDSPELYSFVASKLGANRLTPVRGNFKDG